MTQGIFLHGSRPKSKKEIKTVLDGCYQDQKENIQVVDGKGHLIGHQHDLYCIVVEATSLVGYEFDGSLARAERKKEHGPFTFVGPDPYTARRFYGNLQFKTDKNNPEGRWTIK